MQGFYEWLLSLIDREELNTVLRVKKFQVPGFREISKIPQPRLIAELKRQQRQDSELMKNIISMIAIGTGEKVDCYEDFEDFVEKMEMNWEMKHYHIIALIYHYYPESFEQHWEQIKHNVEAGIPVLSDLSTQEVAAYDKLVKIIEQQLEDEKEVLLEYEALLLDVIDETDERFSISQKYRTLKEIIDGTEESLFQGMQRVKLRADEQYLAFIVFLLLDDHVQQEKYQPFLQFAKKAMLESELDYYQSETRTYIGALEHIVPKYEEIEKKVESLESEVEAVATLTEENQQLKERTLEQEKIVEAYKRKIDRYSFFIVTKEEDFPSFLPTLFKGRLMTVEQFNKNCTEESIIKGNVFFMNRSMFSSSKEWMQIKRKCEKQEILYTELVGYGVEAHIEQIIHYFYTTKGDV